MRAQTWRGCALPPSCISLGFASAHRCFVALARTCTIGHLQSPRNLPFSAGLDRAIYTSPLWNVRTNALYAYTRSDRSWRGLNLHPPVDGVRPDTTDANLVEAGIRRWRKAASGDTRIE